MIDYLVEGRKFSMSYRELKEEHERFCSMRDEEFISQLPAAAHLACVICFLKELPTYCVLGDLGVVHELIHLMHIPDGNTTTLREIRKLYEETLKLA